jgi:hypothetical protein
LLLIRDHAPIPVRDKESMERALPLLRKRESHRARTSERPAAMRTTSPPEPFCHGSVILC